MIDSNVESRIKELEDKIETGYVPKDNLGHLHLIPVPENLENYYVVPYDSSFYYDNKMYDPLTESWVLNDKVRIDEIRNECKTVIYAKYSVEDQNNISFLEVDDPERIEAVTWINGIRTISKNAIADGTPVSEVVWEFTA